MSEAFVAGFFGGVLGSAVVVLVAGVIVWRKIKEKLENSPFGMMT